MVNCIEETILLIDQTTTLFYQQKNEDGYQLLDKTLNSLMQAVNLVSGININGNQVLMENKLNAILGNAMAAIEARDMILLSDILIFDLKELLIKYYYNQA